jgi:cytochrome c oxidase subunit 2
MRTQVVVQKPQELEQWIQEQQVASTEELKQAVAMNPTDLSPHEFLTPYTSQMGIHSEMLHQLHK